MKTVVFHPEAEEELRASVAYYEIQPTGVGLDLQEEVKNAVKRIRRRPRSFPVHKKTVFRMCVLKRFPYSVFFQEQEEFIWIAALAHHKRKPGYWEKRFLD